MGAEKSSYHAWKSWTSALFSLVVLLRYPIVHQQPRRGNGGGGYKPDGGGGKGNGAGGGRNDHPMNQWNDGEDPDGSQPPDKGVKPNQY